LVLFDDNTIGAVCGTNINLLSSSDNWMTASIVSTVSVAGIGSASTGAKADGEHNMYVVFPDFTALTNGTTTTTFRLALVSFSDGEDDDDFALASLVFAFFAMLINL
jgi:hypothetical protein